MRKPNTSLRDDEAPFIPIVQLPSSRISRLATNHHHDERASD
ncbi:MULTISPECIES: hypothetical protein [Enterobacterales]|nr:MULTISPECIES: hypothetical protein [Enterobacterales]